MTPAKTRREALRRSATKRRSAMLVPTIAILAPVMLLPCGGASSAIDSGLEITQTTRNGGNEHAGDGTSNHLG